ncbi:MAG TPA: M56 family metallopeptidase [Epulopiscium sp.]|nr:M56 family metallopeptidase [Candidatus Epulonipiscium sp.]
MFFSFSSLLSVIVLSSLLIVIISLYLRDIERMIHIGIGSLFIFIGIITVRLIFPFEFTFSNSFASRRIMPTILSTLNTPIINAFNRGFTLLNLLLFIWGVGIVITTVITIKTHLHFRQVIKQLPALCDSKINEMLHTITQDYKKLVSFQIISSSLISTPVLYGFYNPKIILPAMDLTDEEWHFILKHEVIHFYNRDLQIKMFIQLLRIIYWWNPFVHLLNHQVDKILEIRTDLEVTKNMTEDKKISYLDCLLKVAKNLSSQGDPYYLVAFDNGMSSLLSQRFHLILKAYNPSNSSSLKTILMAIPLILLLYFSFITVFEPYSISPEDASYTIELTTTNSYLVENQGGGYDLYFNDDFFGNVTSIKDSYSNLTIYKNIEEAPKK